MAIPNAAVGLAVTVANVVAPSILMASVWIPPSLTDKCISPSIVTFRIVTSLPDTIIFKSLPTPTDRPVSFNTPIVPETITLSSIVVVPP